MTSSLRTLILLLLSGASAWAGSWKPRLAAEYLDARQKDWPWQTPICANGTYRPEGTESLPGRCGAAIGDRTRLGCFADNQR